jgi:X-Pro dipeptidyl-peptidase
MEPDRSLYSEARFDILAGESVFIPVSLEGVMIHARLFHPDTASDPDWRSPVILVKSPYFQPASRVDPLDPASRPASARMDWLITHFVPRGYTVALADVRGTGESGGCQDYTDTAQMQDGYDIVEWLGTRDWSNGNVGMYGISYDGETQQGAAVLAPPHLKTIVPLSSISGAYEWDFYDGVPFTLHSFNGNLGYTAGDSFPPGTTTESHVRYHERIPCQPEFLAHGLDRDGDWDAFWEDREFRPRVGDIQASVLHVHGLQDWNVRHVAIRDWFDLIPSEKRAVYGQWAHNYPDSNGPNPEWSRQDWRDIVHRWFDHFLLGLENGILEDLPPVQVQDTSGVWRAEDTYPPQDSMVFSFHLQEGSLTSEPGVIAPPLRLRENIEAFLRAQDVPLPSVDTSPVQEILLFESEPLAQRLQVSGWPVLEFDLALEDGLLPQPGATTDAHFAANLYRSTADGGWEWYNAGYLSARHRDGVADPQPVPKGTVITYTLRFHPEETVLPEGTRIRLTLAGSDVWTEPEGTLWQATLSRGLP